MPDATRNFFFSLFGTAFSDDHQPVIPLRHVDDGSRYLQLEEKSRLFLFPSLPPLPSLSPTLSSKPNESSIHDFEPRADPGSPFRGTPSTQRSTSSGAGQERHLRPVPLFFFLFLRCSSPRRASHQARGPDDGQTGALRPPSFSPPPLPRVLPIEYNRIFFSPPLRSGTERARQVTEESANASSLSFPPPSPLLATPLQEPNDMLKINKVRGRPALPPPFFPPSPCRFRAGDYWNLPYGLVRIKMQGKKSCPPFLFLPLFGSLPPATPRNCRNMRRGSRAIR